MTAESMIGKEKILFEFMKSTGYPVFHLSNIFLRDIEYGIRDYYRVTLRKDIGARESIRLAKELILDLEMKKIISPLSGSTWIMNMPEFLNKPNAPAEAVVEPASS